MTEARLVEVGERIEARVTWSEEEVRAYAALAGDANPIHHDVALAERRCGGISVSGAQLGGRVMGMTASHFASRAEVLGLDFQFRFHQHALAGTPLHFLLEVVDARYNAAIDGTVVTLEGSIRSEDGALLMGTGGRVSLHPLPAG